MRAAGILLLILLVLLAARPAPCKDAPARRTAAEVTEPAGACTAPSDVVLAGGATPQRRTLVLLVDPSPALRGAGFAAALEGALAKVPWPERPGLTIGLALTTDKKGMHVAPGRDPAPLVAAVTEALKGAKDSFRDVYAAAARTATAMARRGGARDLVIVSLTNGDTETDLEGALKSVRRSKVRASCITHEAMVADSYYLSGTRSVPRGVALGSGDAPYVTLPWGWLFQQTIANETTPSGYAPYGLTRFAAATGGRVFLYAPPSSAHRCAYYGFCPFCGEDHQPRGEDFQTQRLRALAPSARSRAKTGASMARDPWLRAVTKTWTAAAKAGLLRSRPSVRLTAGGVRPERRVHTAWLPLLGSSLAFARLATKADKARKDCERLIAGLQADMAKIEAGRGSPRYHAFADFTFTMLHVTHANLLAFSSWCRDVAPVLLDRREGPPDAPEVTSVLVDRRVAGVSYTPMSLCHGVTPFRALHLPGGAAWEAELERLDRVVTATMRRYAHTPYALALRHQGLARFTFTYRGKATPLPPRPKPGSTSAKPTTETGRPNRAGGSTGGGSSAPTTGGG